MSRFHRFALAALLGGVTTATTPAIAQVPTDSSVREMSQRLQTLQQQLDQLTATRDAAAQQHLMQQNWQGMQEYLSWMRDHWGAGYPWMMGHREMGCPMMGGGVRTAWQLPPGMGPTQYWQ